MYSLLTRIPLPAIAARELPPLGVALVIAELFYKFHSFTLECAAFLITWYALSWLFSLLLPGRRD